MYQITSKKLAELKKPINVCIVGCGWFGGGVLRQLLRFDKLNPQVIITKTPEKAVSVYLECGIKKEDIAIAKNAEELREAQKTSRFVVAEDINLIKELKNIDVVFEATRQLISGAEAALNSIDAGIHFVTVNAEMDATIGLILSNLAKKKGVVYSNSDGDQPGVLARMLNEICFQGFQPVIAGNCKEFLDLHQTPEGIKKFISEGVNPVLACSSTDGSKQSLELAVVGNAFGFFPLKRGCHGPRTPKIDIISTFDKLVNLDSLKEGCIDFTLGSAQPNEGGPVFVIAKSLNPKVKTDMKWMKKGPGPFYLFFRDHHLCYFEALSSITDAALFNMPTISPKGRYVDVITIAKKDLKAGQKLDGIGGFDCYGLVEKADTAAREGFLPIGLAEFAKLKQDIKKDMPVTYEMVELEDNTVVKLRKEQDKLPLS